ncbi:MAG TPA: DUF5666 domain-containing protein [Candidatus Paceibacterota bacterium]
MKGKLAILVAMVFVAFFTKAEAFSGSEVHITKDGVASITGVKVMQIAGGTFFTRMYWGDAFVRLTVKTNSKTKFYRGTGEVTSLSEISVGDMLDISGQLSEGDTLGINAGVVKNSSVQKMQNVVSGKVVSVDQGSNKFTLNSEKLGVITVATNSGTKFIKGNRTLDLAHVLVGDTITKIVGDYDIPTKTLAATSATTYVDTQYYVAKNFQGTLKEISSTRVPTSIKLSIEGKIFTVNISEKTSILNTSRNTVSLNRFVLGDTVRIYGTIREVDEPIIDVEVVRNISL